MKSRIAILGAALPVLGLLGWAIAQPGSVDGLSKSPSTESSLSIRATPARTSSPLVLSAHEPSDASAESSQVECFDWETNGPPQSEAIPAVSTPPISANESFTTPRPVVRRFPPLPETKRYVYPGIRRLPPISTDKPQVAPGVRRLPPSSESPFSNPQGSTPTHVAIPLASESPQESKFSIDPVQLAAPPAVNFESSILSKDKESSILSKDKIEEKTSGLDETSQNEERMAELVTPDIPPSFQPGDKQGSDAEPLKENAKAGKISAIDDLSDGDLQGQDHSNWLLPNESTSSSSQKPSHDRIGEEASNLGANLHDEVETFDTVEPDAVEPDTTGDGALTPTAGEAAVELRLEQAEDSKTTQDDRPVGVSSAPWLYTDSSELNTSAETAAVESISLAPKGAENSNAEDAFSPSPSDPANDQPTQPAPIPQPSLVAEELTPEQFQRALVPMRRRASRHIQRGIELADRKAFYSARTEFVRALRLLSQGMESLEGKTHRSEALARGLRAVEEADDFIPRGDGMNADVQIERIVAAHRTTVLKSNTDGVTPLQALQAYYTYAQQQLAVAVMKSPEGSRTLSSLGKLYVEMDRETSRLMTDARTKGLVFQQAALLVNPNNAKAANELGVLLAQDGRYERARDWLRHSVTLIPQTETWHNLAVVHAHLGENQLAQAASRQSLALAKRDSKGRPLPVDAPPHRQVRRVSPREFSAVAPVYGVASPSKRIARGSGASNEEPQGMWDWLPWR